MNDPGRVDGPQPANVEPGHDVDASGPAEQGMAVDENIKPEHLPALKTFVITESFTSISTMQTDSDRHSSGTLNVCGVKWGLRLSRRQNDIWICFGLDANEYQNFSIETRVELRHIQTSGKCFTESFSHKFQNDDDYIGFKGFMEWDVLLQNLSNNEMIVEAKVEILKVSGTKKTKKLKDFGSSIVNETNIALIIKNEQFHVDKHFLAYQSPVLEKLFFETHPGKTEYIIEDVEPEQFQVLLELLYNVDVDHQAAITFLLHLTKKFEMMNATCEIEEALILKNGSTPLNYMFKLAYEYNLEKLKARCIDLLETRSQVISVKDEDLMKAHPSFLELINRKLAIFENSVNIRSFAMPVERKSSAGVWPHFCVDNQNNGTFISAKSASFEFTCPFVKNVNREHLTYFCEFTLFGAQWIFRVKKNGKFLSFDLSCSGPSERIWSFETNLEFKVISIRGAVYGCNTTFTFSETNILVSCPTNLTWNDFIYTYIADGQFVIEVTGDIVVKTEMETIRKFDGSSKHHWDTVLLVENEKFYLSRGILCSQSPFFNIMLDNNSSYKEAAMKEKRLEGICPNDFRNLLGFIHHEPVLSDDTVIGILRLAQMYLMDKIIWKCCLFLFDRSGFPKKFMLKTTLFFRLDRLRMILLVCTSTAAGTKELMGPEVKEMNASVYASLEIKLRNLTP